MTARTPNCHRCICGASLGGFAHPVGRSPDTDDDDDDDDVDVKLVALVVLVALAMPVLMVTVIAAVATVAMTAGEGTDIDVQTARLNYATTSHVLF